MEKLTISLSFEPESLGGGAADCKVLTCSMSAEANGTARSSTISSDTACGIQLLLPSKWNQLEVELPVEKYRRARRQSKQLAQHCLLQSPPLPQLKLTSEVELLHYNEDCYWLLLGMFEMNRCCYWIRTVIIRIIGFVNASCGSLTAPEITYLTKQNDFFIISMHTIV